MRRLGRKIQAGAIIFALLLGMFPVDVHAVEGRNTGDTFYQDCEVLHPEQTNPVVVEYNQKAKTFYAFASENTGAYYRLTLEGGKYTGYSVGYAAIQYPNGDGTFTEVSDNLQMNFTETQAKMPQKEGCTLTQSRVIWLSANARMKFALEPYPNRKSQYATETPDITLTLEKLSLGESDIDWSNIELQTTGLSYYNCFNAAGLTVKFGNLATEAYFDGTQNQLLELEWMALLHQEHAPAPGVVPSLDVTLEDLYEDAGCTTSIAESDMTDGSTYYGILSVAGTRVSTPVPIVKKPVDQKGRITSVTMQDEYTQNFGESTPSVRQCTYTAEYSDGRYFPYEEQKYRDSGSSCIPLFVTSQGGGTKSFTSIDDAAKYMDMDSSVEYVPGYFQLDFDGLIVQKEAKIYSNPYCAVKCSAPAKAAYVYGGGEEITKEDLAMVEMELKQGAKNTLTSFDMRQYPEYERNHLIWNLDFGVDLGDGTLSKDIDLIADTLGLVGTQTVDMTVVYSGCIPSISTTYPITIQGLPYDSIEVVTPPDRLVYAGPDCGSIGSIDLTGLKIRAHIADTGEYDEFTYTGKVGSDGILMPDSFDGTALENYDKNSIKSYFKCSVANGWGSANGKYEVTVSAMKQSTTFEISALRRLLKSYKVIKEPDRLRYLYLDYCSNGERMSLNGAVLRMEFYTDWEWNEDTEEYGHTYTEDLKITNTNDQFQTDVQPQIYLPNGDIDEGYKIRVQGDAYDTKLNCSLTLRSGGKDGLQVGKINNAFIYGIEYLWEREFPEFDDIEEVVETTEAMTVIRRMTMPLMGLRIYKVTADKDYECTFSCTQSGTRYNGRSFRALCYNPDNTRITWKQVNDMTANSQTATLDHWKMYKGDVVYLVIDPIPFSSSDTTTFTMKLRREPLERTPVEKVELNVKEPVGDQDIAKIEAPAGANYKVTGGWMRDGKLVEGKTADYAAEYALSLRLDVTPGYRFGKKDSEGNWTEPDITLGNDVLQNFSYKVSDGGRIIMITFSPFYTDCKVDISAAGGFTKHESDNAKTGYAAYGSDYQFYFTDSTGQKTSDLVVKDGDQIILPDADKIYWLYDLKRCVSVTSSIKQDTPGADETLLKFYENKDYQNPSAPGGTASFNLIDTMTGKVGASIRDNTSGGTSLPARASYYPVGSTLFFYGWYRDVNAAGNGVGERFISSTVIPGTADRTLPLYAKWDEGIFEVRNLTLQRIFRHKVLSYDEDNHLKVAITDMGPMMSTFSMRANMAGVSAVLADEETLVLSNDFDVPEISDELNVEINDIVISEVGENAFAGETEFTRIVLPDTVERVEANAFSGCSGLKEIVITSPDTKLTAGAFFNCEDVTVFFPEDTKVINPLAFVGSSNMKVVLNDSDAEKIDSVKILKGMGIDVDCVSVSLDKKGDILSMSMDEETTIEASLVVNKKVQKDESFAWSYTDKEGTVILTEGEPVKRAAHTIELKDGVLTLEAEEMITEEDGVCVTATEPRSGQKKSITLVTEAANFTEKVAGKPGYTINVPSSDLSYTGEEICPVITVTRGEKILDSSRYQVTYQNNVEIGQAKVIVSGIEEKGYKGKLHTFYTIDKGIQQICAEESQSVSLDVRDAKVQAVLTSGDGALSFENSDDDIAVIAEDGTITPKKAGTTTVTVCAAETEHYKAAAIDITLIVTGTDSTPEPGIQPTSSAEPTGKPSAKPSVEPSRAPSAKPSVEPSRMPAANPSANPGTEPTGKPSVKPSVEPSRAPSAKPSVNPGVEPSKAPTAKPSAEPSKAPTAKPSAEPSKAPTVSPSVKPTLEPSKAPTVNPGVKPTPEAGKIPTAKPDTKPTPVLTGQPATLPGTTGNIKDGGSASASGGTNAKQLARVVISKVKAAKKKLTVMWKKVNGAAGYRIQLAENKKFKKRKKQYKVSAKKLKKVFSGLKAKKVYYIRIAAWRRDSNGKVIYGKYSKIKKVKTK